MKKFVLLLLAIFSLTEAFSVSNKRQLLQSPFHGNPSLSTSSRSNSHVKGNGNGNSLVILQNSLKDKEYRDAVYADSEKRGAILLGFVVLLNIWIFSIPTELRRGHFCFTEGCTQNRSRCYDCQTIPEWIDDVKAYYANGGGVKFDFSVEEDNVFKIK